MFSQTDQNEIEMPEAKEKWLLAGSEAFAKNGLESLNIDESAKAVQTSETSFYHFFGSKSEFFFSQLKSLSLNNKVAQGYFKSVLKKREGVGTNLFMDFGLSKNEAKRATELFIILEIGEIVLSDSKRNFKLKDKEVLQILKVKT